MGTVPASVRTFAVSARRDLVEASALVSSDREPGVLFTVNDSGNDALLFAIDTTGADRGAWRLDQARNVDWEAASSGPCRRAADSVAANSLSAPPRAYCLYIGDVGDNARRRSQVTVYRVTEPMPQRTGFEGVLEAERITVRYPDAAHDVEAMYVTPDGTTMLITKRALRDGTGRLRPALVFAIDPSAWETDTSVVARLVDSLAIVPGTNALRAITDASLSPDGRRLAVRTYGQVYVFATDPLTGRVRASVAPTVCNIARTEAEHGEGVTWFGNAGALLLNSEGLNAPLHLITCPLPAQ